MRTHNFYCCIYLKKKKISSIFIRIVSDSALLYFFNVKKKYIYISLCVWIMFITKIITRYNTQKTTTTLYTLHHSQNINQASITHIFQWIFWQSCKHNTHNTALVLVAKQIHSVFFLLFIFAVFFFGCYLNGWIEEHFHLCVVVLYIYMNQELLCIHFASKY